MRTFHYVPILKSRAGETRALHWVRGRVRPNLLPIWELVPGSSPENSQPIRDASQLTEAWGAEQRVLVDHTHISARFGTAEAMIHARWFYEKCLGRTRAIPVLRRANGPELNQALLARVDKMEGCAIRVASNDVLRGTHLLPFLEETLATAGLTARAVDLIVDFGVVASATSELEIAEAAYRLARIPALQEWRTFAITAGAFPENLTKFCPGKVERTPRADWNLWQQIVATRALPRNPDFGDYAVQHPDLPPPVKGPRRASPSLRYTVDNYWLVVRGKREKGQVARPSQFRDRCLQLVGEREFAGQWLCEGDEAIARCAAGSVSNGDQSFWRAVATDHHITLVWDRLADLAASQAA